MKATLSGVVAAAVMTQTVGDLLRRYYAVVHPPMVPAVSCPLGDPNPTVGDLMARFTAVVYKRNGYLTARPAWLNRQPRRRQA